MPSQSNTSPFIPWNGTDPNVPFPSLTEDEVHIWRSPLDMPASILTQLHIYLSEDEQDRAARFRFDHHRHHFIVGRGILRVLLGQYVQQEPQDLVFGYGNRGKPFLQLPSGERSQGSLRTLGSQVTRTLGYQATTLQFNVSHSGGVALYAIAHNRRVGIDLEEARPMPNAAQLAERFFTEREYAQLLAQPPEQQELAFFRGWTRKEAYLKATGEGLGGLETVEVSLLEEQPRVLAAMTPKSNDVGTINSTMQWHVYDISLDTNHRAAVVIEMPEGGAHPCAIRFFDMARDLPIKKIPK